MTLAFPKPVRRPKVRKPMKRHNMRQKRVSEAEMAHMGQVKALPCVICQMPPPSDCHHTFHDRYSQKKASNFATIPLCKAHHQHGIDAIHNIKDKWRYHHGPDWSYIPETLQAIYGDEWNIDH